jgi:hypothetical protein
VSQINRPPQFVGLEIGFQERTRTFTMSQAVNGGLDFGESTQTALSDGTAYSGNCNGQWVNVQTPSTPNTEFAIPHTLNRIPSYFTHVNTDVAAQVYQLPDTGTTWTATNIYVKCTAASANLRMFVS